jgi:hypothetical protein
VDTADAPRDGQTQTTSEAAPGLSPHYAHGLGMPLDTTSHMNFPVSDRSNDGRDGLVSGCERPQITSPHAEKALWT